MCVTFVIHSVFKSSQGVRKLVRDGPPREIFLLGMTATFRQRCSQHVLGENSLKRSGECLTIAQWNREYSRLGDRPSGFRPGITYDRQAASNSRDRASSTARYLSPDK